MTWRKRAVAVRVKVGRNEIREEKGSQLNCGESGICDRESRCCVVCYELSVCSDCIVYRCCGDIVKVRKN